MVKRHFILVATCLLAALGGSAKTFEWRISTPSARAETFTAYHGETVRFNLVFSGAMSNVSAQAIYYQTNGMGSADYFPPIPGTVFAPSNDIGAAEYRFFIRCRDADGVDYTANGRLRLLDSPGFTPSAVELPVKTLDFASIAVANAPYYTKDETDERIVALAPAPGNYAAVSNAAMNAVQTTDMDWLDAESKMGAITASGDEFFPWRFFGSAFLADELVWPGDGYNYHLVYDESAMRWITWHASPGGEDMIDEETGRFLTQEDIAYLSDIAAAATAATNYTDEAIANIDLDGYATTGDLAALASETAPAVAAYPRIYSFMTGATNANFVVTNYQLTAEADASRTHFDPADPDLDFSTVPSSLRLEDFSSGTNRVVCDTRDWTVWYYTCKIGRAFSDAVSNAVETCRAWCGFTATGMENPVPDTLIVDVPNIWLMAGKTFEKHIAGTNSMWVIRSKDTVVPISDNSQSAGGFLELTDAFGEPYIRFNKAESYFIDPSPDGISYDSSTGAWCISYPTQNKPKGGANAVLEGSTTYPGKAILKDEDDPDCPATITWTGSAGAWVMNAVPKAVGGVVPSQMFFGAVIEVEGQDYIEYLRPMSIPHLLVDGVKIAPVVPATHPAGSTVTWQVVP